MASSFDWAGEMGRNWAGRQSAMRRQLAPVSAIGMEVLAPRPGEKVLDLGCGGGATSLMIAEAVGQTGRVSGLDVSPDLLEIARAGGAGVPQLDFIEADAQTHEFGDARYDALFSQFGCMFFDDPPAAFANLRRALVPRGRVVLLVYADIAHNPWARVPSAAAATVLGPAEPPAPGAPGPFGWSDPAIFRSILDAGGFRDIAWEARDLEVEVGTGDDPDPVTRAVTLLLLIGPVARRMKDAPEGAADRLAPVLAEALAPHVRDGAVRLDARIWVVTARA